MSDLRAQFVLSLEDKLSAGLKNIEREFRELADAGRKLTLGDFETGEKKLRGVANAARDAERGFHSMRGAIERAHAAVGRFTGFRPGAFSQQVGALGALGSGYALIEPVRKAAEYDTLLRQIAIQKGLSGAAAEAEIRRLGQRFNAEGLDTGQSAISITEAYRGLINRGLSNEEVDRALPFHSRAAVAYHVDPTTLEGATGAMVHQLGLRDGDLGAGYAVLARAGMTGQVKMADFSASLPVLASTYQMAGLRGVGTLREIAAASEVIAQVSGGASQGATNFQAALSYLNSPFAAHAFAGHSRGMSATQKALYARAAKNAGMPGGIDLPKLILEGEKNHKSELITVVELFKKMSQGMTPDETGFLAGQLFHNQEARIALLGLIQNWGQFNDRFADLGGADPQRFATDYDTARNGPGKALDQLTESTTQVTRAIGDGFSPTITWASHEMSMLAGGINDLSPASKQLLDDFLQLGGGVLAITAALGALGFIAGPVGAGAALVGGVVGSPAAAIGGVAAAGYEIAKASVPIGNEDETSPFEGDVNLPRLWDTPKDDVPAGGGGKRLLEMLENLFGFGHAQPEVTVNLHVSSDGQVRLLDQATTTNGVRVNLRDPGGGNALRAVSLP